MIGTVEGHVPACYKYPKQGNDSVYPIQWCSHDLACLVKIIIMMI